MPTIGEAIHQLNRDLTARDRAAAEARARSSALESVGVDPSVAVQMGATPNLANTYLQQYLKPKTTADTAAMRNWKFYESLPPESQEKYLEMMGRAGGGTSITFGAPGSYPVDRATGGVGERIPPDPKPVGRGTVGFMTGDQYSPMSPEHVTTTVNANEVLLDGDQNVLFDARPTPTDALAATARTVGPGSQLWHGDEMIGKNEADYTLSPGQERYRGSDRMARNPAPPPKPTNVPPENALVGADGSVVHENTTRPDSMTPSFYEMFRESFSQAAKDGYRPIPVDVNGDGRYSLEDGDTYKMERVEGAPEPKNTRDWGPGTSFRSQADMLQIQAVRDATTDGFFTVFKVDEDGYLNPNEYTEERTPSQLRTDTGRAKAVAQRVLSARHAIKDIMTLVREHGSLAAGWGSYLNWVPESAARDVSAKLETISSIVAFSRLQEMRDNSKSGGALGQISNLELTLLSSTLGSLAQNQSPEAFMQNLRRVDDVLSGRVTPELRKLMNAELDRMRIRYEKDPDAVEQEVLAMTGGVDSEGNDITQEDVAGWFHEKQSRFEGMDGDTLSDEEFARLAGGG